MEALVSSKRIWKSGLFWFWTLEDTNGSKHGNVYGYHDKATAEEAMNAYIKSPKISRAVDIRV